MKGSAISNLDESRKHYTGIFHRTATSQVKRELNPVSTYQGKSSVSKKFSYVKPTMHRTTIGQYIRLDRNDGKRPDIDAFPKACQLAILGDTGSKGCDRVCRVSWLAWLHTMGGGRPCQESIWEKIKKKKKKKSARHPGMFTSPSRPVRRNPTSPSSNSLCFVSKAD